MVTITESVNDDISVEGDNGCPSEVRPAVRPEEDFGNVNSEQAGKAYNPHDNFATGPEFYISGKPISEITHADIFELTFTTLEEAEAFYNRHALAVGFSVRKNEMKKNRKGQISSRRWVCYRQGLRDDKWISKKNRQKNHKPITRCNCEAAFKVSYRAKQMKWQVVHFNPKHNHQLTSKLHLHFLRSNRNVNSCDLAQAMSLKSVGIKTCQIMDAMVERAGGFQLVGYTKKDLQNKIEADKRKLIGESDAMSAIAYLAARVETDPGFFCRYTVDDHNRLRNLFWADSTARRDYNSFGQAMAFDSTYKNNAYGKPLVIVCGVNHHYRTTIFGFALLADEKKDSYEWFLQTFLTAMGGDGPNAVLTDGDLAMREAIARVLPKTRHRLCAWHLLCNAETRIHDDNFTAKLGHCMLSNCTVAQFDKRWARLLNRFGLTKHPWTMKLSDEKEHWADAYFKGIFCAGMRTTSRNESMNKVIKKNLHERIKLYEFVRVLDRALANVRNNESKDDFDSISSDIVPVTHLKHYETQAAKLYTKSVFNMIREELWDEGKLILKKNFESEGKKVYIFTVFQRLHEQWTVSYDPHNEDVKCSCKGMESVGIPCCHTFAVMKAENLSEIPQNMVLKRWTKDAKFNEPSSQMFDDRGDPSTRMARVAALSTICNKLCYTASLDGAVYEAAKHDLHQLSEKMNELLPRPQAGPPPPSSTPKVQEVIQDPIVANTKGAPKSRYKGKQKRACSRCKQSGHNVKTCKRKAKANLCRARSKRRKTTRDEDILSDSWTTASK